MTRGVYARFVALVGGPVTPAPTARVDAPAPFADTCTELMYNITLLAALAESRAGGGIEFESIEALATAVGLDR